MDGLYSNVGQRSYGFGQADDADFGGVGGHFFWRDSEKAMVGLEAGCVFSDPVDSYELGIEAERYFDWLTVGAKAGVAWIGYDQPNPLIETDKDAFFCQLYLGAYPVDNLLVTAIAETRFDNNFVGIEVEYELPVRGLSVFASAMIGDHEYDQAFVGMRYYFGEEKPLKNRHRESDPKNQLPGILSGIGTYNAEIHELVVRNAKSFSGGTGSNTWIGGATLTLGAGTTTVGSGKSNLGTGTLVLGSGNSSGSGTTTVGSGTLTVGGGTLTVGGGTLTAGGGTLTAGGGTLTAGGGTLTAGSGTTTVVSGTLTLVSGTTTLGTLILGNGSSPSDVNHVPGFQLGDLSSIDWSISWPLGIADESSLFAISPP